MGWKGWLAEGWLTGKRLLGEDQLTLSGDTQTVDLAPVDDLDLLAPLHETIALDLSPGLAARRAG
jgi:hypothetical protein